MSEPKSRKTAPRVTEGIDRNLTTLTSEVQPNIPVTSKEPFKAPPMVPIQGEPRPIHELLDYSKLQFGQKLIWWCIFLIVVLSFIGYFWDGANPGGNELSTAIELLKLVTTTALGFVFAKTQVTAQQVKKNDGE